MRYKESFKNRVKQLRKAGKTYSEIQKTVKKSIPKSTLSYWCKDIPLPLGFQRRIKDYSKFNLNKARTVALAVIKAKREEFLKNLKEKNLYLAGRVDRDIQKIMLSILYYCEGAKWKGHSGLQLGSSDPELIKFYLSLLGKCYNINNDKLRCRVGYRADQNIGELQKFWSKLTKIPLKHFFKTKPDPRSIGKKTKKKDYKGVCVISYSDTKIQLELEIIAKILFKGPIAQLVER
ncbi:hypothetical protein ISS21_02135 [Patescibacteria group bacterium]|nr:hypothetical protein [Patescibacteria group bacterium]